MNLNWSNKVIKYVLLVFNFLFVISGIVMIAVGVSVKAFYNDYDIFLNDSYFSLPNLLIAIGALIFIISFFGCCGALKESWFMIFVFSILLALIFILEFSAGIAGYVLRDKTSAYLRDHLKESMSKYAYNDTKSPNPQTKSWDEIQRDFECCGANGPEDWSHYFPRIIETEGETEGEGEAAKTTNETNFNLPGSCCKSKPGATGTFTCNANDTTTATYFKRGCVEGFGNFLKEHAVTLGGVGIAFAFLQLFGVVFGFHLTKQLKNGFYST